MTDPRDHDAPISVITMAGMRNAPEQWRLTASGSSVRLGRTPAAVHTRRDAGSVDAAIARGLCRADVRGGLCQTGRGPQQDHRGDAAKMKEPEMQAHADLRTSEVEQRLADKRPEASDEPKRRGVSRPLPNPDETEQPR